MKSAREILEGIGGHPAEPEFFLERDEVTTYSINGATRANDYLKVTLSVRKQLDWPPGSIVRFNHHRYSFEQRNLVLLSAASLAPGCTTLLLVTARRPLTPQEIEQIVRGT